MNKKSIQAILFALAILVLLILWDLFVKKMPEHFQEIIDTMQVFGVWVILIAIGIGATGFLFYNLFREIYIQTIRQRAEKLLETALDEKEKYLYISAACYQSGDESGLGFYIYRYYLFELKSGYRFVFKAKKAKEDSKGAFHYFNSIIKRDPLIFGRRGEIHYRFEKDEYQIRIHPFKKRFDEGFEIFCHHKLNNKLIWKSTI